MEECIVCQAPVNVVNVEPRVFINEEKVKRIGYKERTIVVCNGPRCVRLVLEAIGEDGSVEAIVE